MWLRFLGILSPLLDWLGGAIALIAAIILVWTIYEYWSAGPERFAWFDVLVRVVGLGLIGLMALRAQAIVAAIVPGSYGNLPALAPMLRTPYLWMARGIAAFAGIALVWVIYQRWIQSPQGFSWLQAIYLAFSIGVVALIASRADSIFATLIR